MKRMLELCFPALGALCVLARSFLVLAALTFFALGQNAPPSTDVFVADLRLEDGKLTLGDPVNLTRRPGYDNQPSFLPDGKAILYTAFQDDGQTDIFLYDLSASTSRNLTGTPESEYSPTVTPDGGSFSVIRVESDGRQRLWKFPLQGGEPSLVLTDVQPAGYQVWADAASVILFILGEPPTLQLLTVPGGESSMLAERVGRSLHMVPGSKAVSYVFKASEGEWWIRQTDLQSRQTEPLAKCLPGSEDFVWTPSGVLLMGQGSRLFMLRPRQDSEWLEVADLAGHGIRGITRLAVSPQGDRLALVAEH